MILDLIKNQSEVPVLVNKISGTELLWRSEEDHKFLGVSDSEFLDNYSWVIKGSIFNTSHKIHPEQKIAFAERYGGSGLSKNGGGVRVVNLHGAQLKGVGANFLAGRETPPSHSYGGLDISTAAKEIIYSSIINQISPVGAQSIYGMILLDHSSARHEESRSPAVIIIREKCLRLGQLLPCLDFKPHKEHEKEFISDSKRILYLYKKVDRTAEASSLYIALQNFLDKAADQLCFMKFAKFSHNALIPSNLSIDGRLLDTGTCSFVLAGSNYGQLTSVMEEPEVPTIIVSEILYLIKKYSGREDVSAHFTKIYREKYKQYILINAGFILAIDREMSIKLSFHSAWQKFAHKFHSLIVSGCAEKTYALPTIDGRDLANDMLSGSLYSIIHRKEAPHNFHYLRNLTSDLDATLEVSYAAYEGLFSSLNEFLSVAALQILKRAYLSSFFFITYIGKIIDEKAALADTREIVKIINVCEMVSKWVFESIGSERCTIYYDGHMLIFFNYKDQLIYWNDSNGVPSKIGGFSELSLFLTSSNYKYQILSYDFSSFMMNICSFFSQNPEKSFDGVKYVF